MRLNIQKLRKARGMSQMELAKKTGVSRPSIAAYETGRFEPGLYNAWRIAKAFGIKIEELIEEEGDALSGASRQLPQRGNQKKNENREGRRRYADG